jgi:hypothetical protein
VPSALLGPHDIRVKTNFASLSAHVADFWGEPIDNQNGVLTFSGEVEVAAPKGGRIGTMIASNGAVPSAPKTWWRPRSHAPSQR